MMANEKALSIVKTLIHLAKLLNLNLIAEGVETREQLMLLRNLGVQMGQGFLFSKAVAFDEFVAMVTTAAEGEEKQAA
jgi:EAL domain-containing protein (putative c-di-GMP-specific phosphodiesterase class I)